MGKCCAICVNSPHLNSKIPEECKTCYTDESLPNFIQNPHAFDNVKLEIVFVPNERSLYRYYCSNCFYNEDKGYKLKYFPKPTGAKCLVGSVGYFKTEIKRIDE